jgi:hypothetical protein
VRVGREPVSGWIRAADGPQRVTGRYIGRGDYVVAYRLDQRLAALGGEVGVLKLPITLRGCLPVSQQGAGLLRNRLLRAWQALAPGGLLVPHAVPVQFGLGDTEEAPGWPALVQRYVVPATGADPAETSALANDGVRLARKAWEAELATGHVPEWYVDGTVQGNYFALPGPDGGLLMAAVDPAHPLTKAELELTIHFKAKYRRYLKGNAEAFLPEDLDAVERGLSLFINAIVWREWRGKVGR